MLCCLTSLPSRFICTFLIKVVLDGECRLLGWLMDGFPVVLFACCHLCFRVRYDEVIGRWFCYSSQIQMLMSWWKLKGLHLASKTEAQKNFGVWSSQFFISFVSFRGQFIYILYFISFNNFFFTRIKCYVLWKSDWFAVLEICSVVLHTLFRLFFLFFCFLNPYTFNYNRILQYYFYRYLNSWWPVLIEFLSE